MILPEATQPERDIASNGARWPPRVCALKHHSHQPRFGAGAYGGPGESITEVLAWVLVLTRGNIYCVQCLKQPLTPPHNSIYKGSTICAF